MKRRYKIFTAAMLIILAISLSLNIVSAVTQTAEPGSDQDPIVSKSYVDAAINQLSSKIQSLLDEVGTLKNQNTQMTTKLTSQEQTIKALQEELKAVKAGASGTGSTGSTGSAGSGTSGTGGSTGASGGTATAPATLGTGIIKSAVVNLRAKPNTTSTIVGKLLQNNTVTLLSKTGNWYQVKTAGGKTGYVREDLLTVKK